MSILNQILTRQERLQPEAPVVKSITSEEIKLWLISQLAERLEVPSESIDPHKDFVEYGLNSIEAVNLSGGLENYLGCRLSPTLIWDCPNIETLVRYLAEENIAGDITSLTQNDLQLREVQKLLANMDQLSDESVDMLLNVMLPEQDDR